MKVRFAVTPPAAALDGAVFADYLAQVEQLGFDTLWLSDVPLGPLGDPLLALAWAAARTSRLKLGANVVPLGRNPLVLARQLAQLDRLCGGRLLLSFVPGLGAPAERAALGYAHGDRGQALEQCMDLLRRWWAGETLSASAEGCRFEQVAVTPRPLQAPLEIWLGGKGRAALERVARAGDGWLTAAVTPAEAGRGRRTIEAALARSGRCIDAEHYGISIPVAGTTPDEALLAPLRARRADGDLTDIVAVGGDDLRALVEAHLAEGISKFVLRPLGLLDGARGWREDLAWMAAAVLPLQR
ncbi:MAG: LLM class flavin-dependent oxidoreductase [Gammaproteobacteria bacterium]